MKFIPNRYSPAYPAAWLLFGMVFCLAFAQFARLRWQQPATIALYGLLFIWVILLAWRQRRLWSRFGIIDALFWAFILTVTMSLAVEGVYSPAPQKYGQYLPFMAIVPYACGRMMRPRDVHRLSSIIAWAGLVMLILLSIDYWQTAAAYKAYGRRPFFGYDYAPLLIGALLAGSLIVFYFRSLVEENTSLPKSLLRPVANIVIVSLLAVFLVWVAARGAVLAGVFGILCLTLIQRPSLLLKRLAFAFYLIGLFALLFHFLPRPQAAFYQTLLTAPNASYLSEERGKITPRPDTSISPRMDKAVPQPDAPILNTASCQPFEVGTNSVAMRWVLYQEAVAMFMHRPLFGVGAASFGRRSCIGIMGYPHSSILQAFAELGAIGGLLFVGLIVTTFTSFFPKAMEVNAASSTQAAQLALAWFTMYLVAFQVSGNYFTDAGFYLFVGVAAGMRANSAWRDAAGRSNVD